MHVYSRTNSIALWNVPRISGIGSFAHQTVNLAYTTGCLTILLSAEASGNQQKLTMKAESSQGRSHCTRWLGGRLRRRKRPGALSLGPRIQMKPFQAAKHFHATKNQHPYTVQILLFVWGLTPPPQESMHRTAALNPESRFLNAFTQKWQELVWYLRRSPIEHSGTSNYAHHPANGIPRGEQNAEFCRSLISLCLPSHLQLILPRTWGSCKT